MEKEHEGSEESMESGVRKQRELWMNEEMGQRVKNRRWRMWSCEVIEVVKEP